MMQVSGDTVVRFRWFIIPAFVAVSVFFGLQLRNAKIDSDIKSQLPADVPSRISTDKIEDIFGGTEMLMVLVQADDVLDPETLKRVKRISRQVKRIKGVDRVLSMFDLKSIKSEHGAMIVDPAVKRIPRNGEEREKLRWEIEDNDMVYGSVVSKDFTLTAVIAVLEADTPDAPLIKAVRDVIGNNPGPEEVTIGGFPNTRMEVSRDIRRDIQRLLPVGILIMLAFLFVCFRQLRGVVLPFAVVIMAIVFSMGLIPLLGWKITMMTIVLPVILIAVANDYGIHIIAKYQEENVEGSPLSESAIAARIFDRLGKPIILTGLTTMAGMLCLLGHVIIPAQQVGILAALGIAFALAASLFFITAVLSLLPKAKPVVRANSGSTRKPVLERMLGFFGEIVSSRPRWIIGGAILLSAVVGLGIFSVKIDADPNNYFPENSPIVRAARLINKHLGGTTNIAIAFQGDIRDPRIMKKIDRTEREIGSFSEIGNTTSIARVVRQMSRALNDKGEEGYDKIPDTRNGVAQYFELYSMSGDPEDFEKLVDFPYEHALITARLNTTSTPRMSSVVARVNEMVKGDPDVECVGGFGVIFSELARLIVNGQLISLGAAIVLIALILMPAFRSATAGLIAAIPLALAMVILFGLMGFLGIYLNIATAMLSSIMIGVGVDYTIHFLWRYREERRLGLAPEPAVKKTLTTTGRGIVFNAFSVMVGFAVLTASGFLPVRFFGFLVFVSVMACLIGGLVIIPALCIVLRPKFLEPPESK